MTSDSLLASSRRLPARTAASVGQQSRGADDRRHHDALPRHRCGERIERRLHARDDPDGRPERRRACTALPAASSASTANSGLNLSALLDQRLPARLRGERNHVESLGVQGDDVERAAPDASGRAEHRNAARGTSVD